MNHLTRAKSVFEMEIEELCGVLSRLDDNFNKAVDLMSQALDRGNKIVIVGVGKSGNIGAKIVATLNSTGTPTVLLDSLNALHGDLGIVQDGDVCIAMSFSGETSELLALLPFIKRFELPIISMTGNTASSLAKYSDIVLDTGVSREACSSWETPSPWLWWKRATSPRGTSPNATPAARWDVPCSPG